MKTFFVNEAIDKAITDYLNSKDKKEGVLYNSFLVVVIRMLINIYGELDVINPYKIKNEDAFLNNLTKYGASRDDIISLERLILEHLLNEKDDKDECRKTFVEIQKRVIDLFNLKRFNFATTEDEIREFFDLLYTPGTSNALRLSYNYLWADNVYEVAEYYKNKMDDKPTKEELEKDLLDFDVYKMFDVSIADISKMDGKEVDSLNKEIYKSFDIKENAINKDYLLDQKVKEFKIQNKPVMTGNGYVDILLVMSIIITVVMVVVIFSTLVF